MINCIAVDDEPLALELLTDNIAKVPYLRLVACCKDAFSAAQALREHTIDLVFIDIQMPGLTGLQLIDSLQHKPMVILITAYKQYALDGYRLNVLDYLLKPVDMLRFMKACDKAMELHQLRHGMKEAHRENGKALTPDYFFLNVDYSMVKVVYNDIVWVEGLRDYVKIYLKSAPQKPLVARMSIKALEDLLPAGRFLRIHKSYLVSVESVTAIRKNSIFIKDHELAVGETYREAVKSLTGA
jgi:two-component system, LytTR family, response regulator